MAAKDSLASPGSPTKAEARAPNEKISLTKPPTFSASTPTTSIAAPASAKDRATVASVTLTTTTRPASGKFSVLKLINLKIILLGVGRMQAVISAAVIKQRVHFSVYP